ncbi:hypothetical protein HK405_012310 [Cladochytrium tenue]|nr:hypothetical protein HK405_012310 [Cladochytrium tenue]
MHTPTTASARLARLSRPLNLGSLAAFSSPFSNFSRYVDPSGKLNFTGKVVLHADGVDFSNGSSYRISMTELEVREELGKGQYGVVQKVVHGPTKVTMAMKEIRLELDQTKLNQILMELDVLHKSRSPYIVDFYGAFFIESCVYYCMEYMDAGSVDKLYEGGVPEDVLSKISLAPERISVESSGAYTAQSDVWSLGLSLVETALGRYPYPAEEYDSVFDQINAIVMGDPPELPVDEFSENARDFVAQCLLKSPDRRPTYTELLDHPWLRFADAAKVDMAGWAQTAAAAALRRRSAPPTASTPPLQALLRAGLADVGCRPATPPRG